ncbi:MAG: ABC-F family ATP-binding cassette domain-containing protein [Phycisphaerae bacterium]|nr:ABC-F family ATP-binding cassette domain-containing protein [Phycisphaerae bacterium]
MPLLAAANLRVLFGNTIILDGCSLSIEPGERVGIVGRNGTGKTTLLKALAGSLKTDSGSVSLAKGSRAGYLSQDPVLNPAETLRGEAESAFGLLHELHRKLDVLFHEMASASGPALERLMSRQAELEHEMESAGGYAVDHKIDAALHGLGFTDGQFTVPVSGLSGGQLGRLALAKILLENPDLLLLDEPTNHLDLDGCLWLEDFLKNEFRGAVVMVSHDRYLLNHVVHRIIETEGGRLIEYPGNYAAFRTLRADRRLSMLRAWENQQTKFRHEEEYIRRYRAGQRAKQAQGRLTKLEREKDQNTLERPLELDTFSFSLPKAERSADIVIAARSVSKRYPLSDGTEKVLFTRLDVTINRGERWGVIGPNGAGKSTLVRCLLGETPPDCGTVKVGTNVVVGYYRQSHEHIDPERTVTQYLQSVILKENPGKGLSEQQARNLAGAFLFSGDEQGRTLGSLSGGERSRAVLAGLLASSKNLIVLDEPTNHLDIPSAERLEEALSPEGGYQGTLILISHDRALIDATCDHLLVFDGKGGVETFAGNYTDWRLREVGLAAARTKREADSRRAREDQGRKRRAADESRRPTVAPDDVPAADSEARRLAYQLSKMDTPRIEARIEEIERRVREIDETMSLPEVWSDSKRCGSLGDERERLLREMEPLEFEWSRRAGA